MSLLRMSATELTNTDVDFVALVKRGANRLPFRITKGDDEMIDLNAIGRKFLKKADAAPTVVAIIARKEDAASPAVAALAKAFGLDVTTLEKSEDDALVTLTKKDAPSTGVIVVKLDDNTGVSIAHSKLKKGFDNFDFGGTAFAGLAGEQGFCVAPSIAAALHKSAIDAIVADTDLGTLQARLTKANDAFSAYFGVLSAYAPAELMKAGTGNAKGGAGMNQETGDGLGDKANTALAKEKAAKADHLTKGCASCSGKAAGFACSSCGQTMKADAGKNGTGAGVEMGSGTGTNDRATSDDAANTEVDAKPGARVSGDDSGLPAKLKASTQKEGETMDDGSTTGAQTGLPAKLKAKKAELVTVAVNALIKALNFDPDKDGDDDAVMTGESAAGEGAASSTDQDSAAATARASADDNSGAGGNGVTGKVKGKTLDTAGVPAKLMASTTKNDGDADIGKKGKGEELPASQSGAGAQEKEVQTLKGDDNLTRMIQALAKSVQDSNAAVTKSVEALAARVDGVAAMAKKTDAALQGTVFNEDGGDPAPARTVKSDEAGSIPLLDTGLSRRRA